MNELGVWLGRIGSVLPELVAFWEAIRSKDENAELEAQLALTRKVKDRQAAEEIGA